MNADKKAYFTSESTDHGDIRRKNRRMQSLLLNVSAETLEVDRGPTRYALDMALALDARLRAPVFALDVTTPVSTGRQGEVAAADYDQLAKNKASLLQAEAIRCKSKVDVETERAMSFGVVDWLGDLAMLHDITVSGVDKQGLLSERWLAEALLFKSGRPVLIVPRAHDTGFSARRIAVAWDYSAPAARAVAEALPLLARAEDVVLLIVGDDKRFQTCLRPGDVVEGLERRGVHPRVAERQRGDVQIGDILQSLALDEGADLLVMGAFGHSRLQEFILGGATRRVLESLKLPALLTH